MVSENSPEAELWRKLYREIEPIEGAAYISDDECRTSSFTETAECLEQSARMFEQCVWICRRYAVIARKKAGKGNQ